SPTPSATANGNHRSVFSVFHRIARPPPPRSATDGRVQPHHGHHNPQVQLPARPVRRPPRPLHERTQHVVALQRPHVHRLETVVEQVVHHRVQQAAAVPAPREPRGHVQRVDLRVGPRPPVRILRRTHRREPRHLTPVGGHQQPVPRRRRRGHRGPPPCHE